MSFAVNVCLSLSSLALHRACSGTLTSSSPVTSFIQDTTTNNPLPRGVKDTLLYPSTRNKSRTALLLYHKRKSFLEVFILAKHLQSSGVRLNVRLTDNSSWIRIPQYTGKNSRNLSMQRKMIILYIKKNKSKDLLVNI